MKKKIQSTGEWLDDAMAAVQRSYLKLLAWFRSRKIIVETEVKGARDLIQTKHRLDSMPKEKSIGLKLETGENHSALRFPGLDIAKNLSARSGQRQSTEKTLGPRETAVPEGFRSLTEIGKRLCSLWTGTVISGRSEREWQAMERSGQGREAAGERALRDAERNKGAKLTVDEAAQVRKLSELAWNLNNRHQPYSGGFPVQTGTFAARDGFHFGAMRAPDPERTAREACSYSKRQAETADKILRFLEELGRD